MIEKPKPMESLLGKLDQLEIGKEIQLTKEEAELYQVESLDALPIEDQMQDLKNT